MTLFLSLAMCWCADARAADAGAKRNVLLIMVDDMNNDLGCYGHPIVKSPHIDRLARRGTRFDRAYCQYPLCNPSRVSMLSGLRPDQTRVYDLETPPRSMLPDAVFLPQYFRQNGYRAVHIGKIFHTGEAFEDPASWDAETRETGKQPPASAVVRTQKIERPQKYTIEWAMLNSEDAETADGVVARKGAALLKELAGGGQPFFAAIGFRRPHAPYAAPQKYFDRYAATSIPLLDEPAEHLKRIPEAAFTYPPGTRPINPSERQQAVAAYYACISFVDAQIGVLLDAVDALDLWHNTVVVFVSDHGYHLGEHGGMWHKMSVFEPSARVPLIVASPETRAGQACPALVELVDIYPTLVDLCGLPARKGLAGHSLRALLDDPTSSLSEAAYTQVRHGETMGRSVRTARWRYTEWDGGRRGLELYDHDRDPGELNNLADDPKLADVRASLSSMLERTGSAAAATGSAAGAP